MKTVKLIDIDTNEIVLSFETKKTKQSSIQDEISQKVRERFGTRLWLQGSIRYGDPNTRLTLGGSLWWITSGYNGKLQYSVE